MKNTVNTEKNKILQKTERMTFGVFLTGSWPLPQ